MAIRTLNLYWLLLLVIILIACSNPSSNSENREFTGTILKMSGQEVVRTEDGQVTGVLSVNEGEESTLITIYFLDEQGQQFHPSAPDFKLDWQISDIDILGINQETSDGKWGFHLNGIAQGTTNVSFSVWHTSEEQYELQTPSIPVQVN